MALIIYGFFLNDVDLQDTPWQDNIDKWWLKYSKFEFRHLFYDDNDNFIGHLVSKEINDEYYARKREHSIKNPLPFEQFVNFYTGEIILYLPTFSIFIDRGEIMPFTLEEFSVTFSKDSIQRIERTKEIIKEIFGIIIPNYSFLLIDDYQ